MIASLCEAYHWSYQEAMSLTLPQIIMLNHAAWVNNERRELKRESDKDGAPKRKATIQTVNPREMTTTELQAYMGGGPFGQIAYVDSIPKT